MIKDLKNNYLSPRNIAIFWTIIIAIGWFFGGTEVALGLVLAAILSFVIIYFTMNSSWEGTIEKIKTERVDKGDEEGSYYKDVTYAYIKLKNGKTKKMRPYPNWKEGDKIKKEKGEFAPRKI